MSYNCPKCRDTKRHSYTYQADVFSKEVTVHEPCECDTSMSDEEYCSIIGKMDANCIYNSEEQNAALLENLFVGKCQITKLEVAKIYGVYAYEN
tara:strand:- start:1557 stop:1838 length:282 start_codon:yes stop_codon:yes gene_type:complete